MRAVVLVGGFGTRLRPLTNTVPKQMLPIVDRPMIEWVVGHLVDHDVDDVVLALGYRPDAFQDRYPDGRCAGADLHYSVESEPLGTAGAIRFAATDAGIDDTFIVVNGDVLTDLDLSAMVAVHASHGGEATIALHEVDDPSRYGVVDLDAGGRVRRFVEKPAREEAPSHLINAGTYVLDPSVLERIPFGRGVSIERETFPELAADGAMWAVNDDGVYWIDTGTPEDYLQVQLDLIDGRRPVRIDGIDPTAVVHPEAIVRRSVAGAHTVIERRAELCDSVIMTGARIGAGASVRGALVGPFEVVPDGQVIEPGAVLARDQMA
ncbi:MAG: sugar phosphate nucleotidyltransferase [Acidimicrobiales bacterium]